MILPGAASVKREVSVRLVRRQKAQHAARERRIEPQELQRGDDRVAAEGGREPGNAGIGVGAGRRTRWSAGPDPRATGPSHSLNTRPERLQPRAATAHRAGRQSRVRRRGRGSAGARVARRRDPGRPRRRCRCAASAAASARSRRSPGRDGSGRWPKVERRGAHDAVQALVAEHDRSPRRPPPRGRVRARRACRPRTSNMSRKSAANSSRSGSLTRALAEIAQPQPLVEPILPDQPGALDMDHPLPGRLAADRRQRRDWSDWR